MRNKYQRTLGLRILGTVSAFSIMFVLLYAFFAGFSLYSSLILVSAIGVLGGQAFVVGESVIECVVAFLEILLESIMGIFEFIGSLFNF
ncbi:hypothetical protein ACUR5C_00635 [Aliikangiella sp. IMCC44653]